MKAESFLLEMRGSTLPDQQISPADGFWSLFQGPDQIRIDGLRLVQLNALVRSFSLAGLEDWFVWYEGAKDWSPLPDLVEFINNAGQLQNLPPIPVKPMTEAYEEDTQPAIPIAKAAPHGEKTQTQTKTITRSLTRDGRILPRFQMRIPATVDFKGKVIRTETIDISLAGMKIKDPVPFPTDAIVIVTLNHNQTELVMRCRVVDSPNGVAKQRLIIETCHRMDLLRKWVLGKNPG